MWLDGSAVPSRALVQNSPDYLQVSRRGLAGLDGSPVQRAREEHTGSDQHLLPPLIHATEPHVSNYTTQSGRVGSALLEDLSSISSPQLFDMLMSRIEGRRGDAGVNRRFDFSEAHMIEIKSLM